MILPRPVIPRIERAKLLFEFGPISYTKARRYWFSLDPLNQKKDRLRDKIASGLNIYMYDADSVGTLQNARMYDFIRRNYLKSKVGEALELLSEGEINPERVRDWVKMGACIGEIENEAVFWGYPQYHSALIEAMEATKDLLASKMLG